LQKGFKLRGRELLDPDMINATLSVTGALLENVGL